jgi:predicted dehydrogenase
MRVAVVGTGSIGRRHLGNLLGRSDAEVLAVSEHSRRTELKVAGKPVPVLPEYGEALERSDAVVIANPSGLHLDYLRAAVSAGKHVYLEKPVGSDSKGFDEVVGSAARSGVLVAVGTQFRFNPLLVRLKQLLDAGKAGTLLNVFAFSGEHIADYHPEEDYRTSYAARRSLGGGVLLTQIHQIDYLSWLFGPFDSVTAEQVALPQLEIDVESSVTYMLAGESAVPVVGHLNYVQRPRLTGLEIIGTRAKVTWLYERNRLSVQGAVDRESEVIEQPLDRNRMFVDAMDDFFAAVRDGTRPRADLKDGVTAVKIVEAIKQSLAERGTRRIRA